MARHALDLFSPVLPITHAVMQRMPGPVERYHLQARDLIHVATCIEEGIGAIVSPDRGFDDVGEITRLAPEDSQAISRYLR
jgi:predicted nucleic acid-binding protein